MRVDGMLVQWSVTGGVARVPGKTWQAVENSEVSTSDAAAAGASVHRRVDWRTVQWRSAGGLRVVEGFSRTEMPAGVPGEIMAVLYYFVEPAI